MKTMTSNEYPATHLMNPARQYVRADHTDIRATFERIRAEQAAQAKPTKSKVRRIR